MTNKLPYTVWAGHDINHNEGRDEWIATLDGQEIFHNKSLTNLKAQLDKAQKASKKFPRFPVYFHKYGEDFITATVTSIIPPNHFLSRTEVWVTYKDRHNSTRRSQENPYNLYPTNPFNDGLISRIKDIVAQIYSLEETKAELINNLQTAEAKIATIKKEQEGEGE